MEELQNITTSTFSFPDIIANKFVYVDKTAYLHELLKDGKNQYFLARLRRFGKLCVRLGNAQPRPLANRVKGDRL